MINPAGTLMKYGSSFSFHAFSHRKNAKNKTQIFKLRLCSSFI